MPTVSLNPQRRPPDAPGPGEFARSSNSARAAATGEWAGGADQTDEDPLLAFHSVHPRGGGVGPGVRPAASPPPVPMRSPASTISPRVIALGLLTFAVGAVGTVSYSRWRESAPPAATGATTLSSEGRAIINSSPTGALVFIDGVARGATPLDLLLPPGGHTLQLQNGASIRTLPLEVQASQSTSHYIELPAAGAAPSDARVEASPPRAPAAPATRRSEVPSRPAASSREVPSRPAASSRPDPLPGASAAPGAPPPARPAVAISEGWAAISVPFPAQVTQNGRTIGTTGTGALALPPGVHTLELSNATFEFRTTLTVAINAGETTRLSVTLPNGSLSVNALPWAEVFVDGRSIGTTPLANVPVPVGSREILWRHPDFGDRRQLINVTARSPVRVGTDLRR